MKRASIASWRAITLLGLALAASSMAAVTPSSGGAGRVPEFTLEQIVGSHSIGQVVLSPDRTAVVYTHVGRYFGHPLLPAFGEDSNLFLLRFATGERLKLTAGPASKSYPTFSPDGRFISYESEGDIWTVEVASGKSRRLTTDWRLDRQAAWSPDGKEIAFVSDRWGRSNIYVMSASGEREGLRIVTPDGVGGTNPVWSSDGRSIVFAAALDEHFYSRGLYSISAAGGGQPQRITPADDARNSWATFFPDGSRIAYVSDRSGYLNIWTMKPDGSDQQQLTREQQDQDYPENDYIQTMGLRFSPDRKRLLYFTNRLGNLDLKTVELASGAAKFIENKDGSHHPVGWLDDRTIAFVYEDYRTQPELYVKPLNGAAKRLTYSSQAAFRAENFERLESVTWNSADGVSIHGYLRRPSWAKSGERLPALVLSHTYNVGQFYNQWSPIFNYIVQSGYVVLQVNHRGSNGYGTKFRDLPKGNWGFEQLKDIESAAGYLRALPDVDTKRIGMLGYSMGGYLTQLAVTNRPALFTAAVAVFGLGEIVGDPQRSSKNYIWHLGGAEPEIRERYRNASPVTRVKDMRAPLMIVHSDGDPIEPVTKIRNFVHEMDKYDKRYELALYSNEAHGLKLPEHQLDSYQRIMAFLDRYLAAN
jgi:dipeptidyl aminopeptidase/acylaminoacyl peptidase